MTQDKPTFKERLYVVIFEAETPAGKLFDILLFGSIMLSVLLTMLSSVDSIREVYGPLLYWMNIFFTAIFTVEYVFRLYCSPKPIRYARSFFGVVDLLSILPYYIGLFFPVVRSLDVVKILRMLRIFRVLKMAQYVGEANLLMEALISSRRKIGIFIAAVLSIVVVLGSLMYVIESDASGFTSIPRSVYWAIVTLTTVGYGDISPATPLGQTLAACIMMIGYSIIAVPSGIITAEINSAVVHHKNMKICPSCGHKELDATALYCKKCGASMG